MRERLPKISPIKCIALFALFTTGIAVFVNYLFDFDGIEFNGDSYVYFQMAQHFKQAISTLSLPNQQHWPYSYPASLSLTFFFLGETFKAAQWMNLIAGGALIAALGYLALFIGRFKTSDQKKTISFILGSMLLMLGRGTMLKYQLLIMSDMMGAFWATLTILLIWKWKFSKNIIPLVFAGVAFGLAISTRYVYALMLIPVSVVLFSEFSLQKRFFTLLSFTLALLITLLPQIIITLNGSLSNEGYELLNDWSLKNSFRLVFESVDGHQTSHITSILYYAALPFRWEDFTPLGLVLVCLGLYYSIHELPRWLWLSLFFWYLSFYILLCGIPIQNPRIAFSLYQPLAIFISLGVLWCLEHWQVKRIMTCVMIMTIFSIVFSVRYIRKMIETKNELKQTAEQVAAIAEKNSRVISTSLYAVYLAYPENVEPMSIYTMTISEVKSILSDRKKTFLAIDDNTFIPQWSNYQPGKTYQWIKDHCVCNVIAHIGDYTVYQINL